MDIKARNGFNNSTKLAVEDFQAPADATGVASLSRPNPDRAWSEAPLDARGCSLINKSGKTQFRVYFERDDNDDLERDYVGWFAADTPTAGSRPQLQIIYQQAKWRTVARVAVSFYPFFLGLHTEKELSEALDFLPTFTGKQIAITETGHPAEPLRIRAIPHRSFR